MRTASTRIVPSVLGLALALAAAAPSAAQPTRTPSSEAVITPRALAQPSASEPWSPVTRPLDLAGALTDRERLLVSLFSTSCGGEISVDDRPDNECPDRLTSGQGINCDTLEQALEGLVDALSQNCKETCSLIKCGERRKQNCGSFGHDYKRDPEDCIEVIAHDCDDKMGFVCTKEAVTCICFCADA